MKKSKIIFFGVVIVLFLFFIFSDCYAYTLIGSPGKDEIGEVCAYYANVAGENNKVGEDNAMCRTLECKNASNGVAIKETDGEYKDKYVEFCTCKNDNDCKDYYGVVAGQKWVCKSGEKVSCGLNYCVTQILSSVSPELMKDSKIRVELPIGAISKYAKACYDTSNPLTDLIEKLQKAADAYIETELKKIQDAKIAGDIEKNETVYCPCVTQKCWEEKLPKMPADLTKSTPCVTEGGTKLDVECKVEMTAEEKVKYDVEVQKVKDATQAIYKKCNEECSVALLPGKCPVVKATQPVVKATQADTLQAVRDKAKGLNPAGFALEKAGVTQLLGKAINFVMFPIGMWVMAMYLWAGVLWATSAGKSESVEKSKQILIWTTLGLIVTLGSYIIVKFVFDLF